MRRKMPMNRWLAALLIVVGLAAVPPVRRAMSAPAPQTKHRVINRPGRTVQAPFSEAILTGDTLYLSGQIGLDPKTGQPPADIEQEVHLLLDGIKATLAEGGMTMDDLVYVQIFCSDLSLFDKFNGVYRTYFTKEFPARAFIGAGSLLRGGHFELQAIAVRR